jgi:site-specific DNA-methyltransferase (cytosine-N4-specific)
MELRVPYTQQFSPQQTPLKRLLPILRQNAGDAKGLRQAIASAFFKDTATPEKVAGNTLIALRCYGIINQGSATLTDFGNRLVDLRGNENEAHALLARHIIEELDGLGIVETLREMKKAKLSISLTSLPRELRQRGYKASSNSSDLSGVLGWLREAKLLSASYEVNEEEFTALVGVQPVVVDVMKGFNREQVAFLRAMVALNVKDWTPCNVICTHAEGLYPGEVHFNWKEIVSDVLKPISEAGLIEFRKKPKQDQETPEGRGGKPADVKPTPRFEEQVAEPILHAMFRFAGSAQIRDIRSKSLAELVQTIKGDDQNASGRALELLAVRFCQLLDLDFMGLRETDTDIVAGGEVDALLQSARLIYSRWQLQCKVGDVTVEAVAKEVGMSKVTLANVIVVLGTKRITKGAEIYRTQIVQTSNMNIILLDGAMLEKIIADNAAIIGIMHSQAQNAMRLKPQKDIGLGSPTPPSGAGPASTPKPGPVPSAKPSKQTQLEFDAAYETKAGRMFCGDSLEVLPVLIEQGIRVKLIVTSPPFALVRKKSYGNEDADRYVEWFEQFIPYFKEILEPSGSLVIDIGGTWIKGLPAKSTYHFKLLLKLCESGFYLAQDFYHYNPARLPTPAEWVTVRRVRVKDAVNSVFWLARDPFVDADNRRVLLPYSDSMKDLLKNGYKAKLRPSGHDISTKFQKDNSGSIPPNLFRFANTASTSHYLRRCREEGIKPHPARFPQALPEFFIKLLTKPGDLILDPFAGSNVTGEAAEALGRQWISIENDPSYVAGSRFRFEAPKPGESRQRVTLRPEAVIPLFPELRVTTG